MLVFSYTICRRLQPSRHNADCLAEQGAQVLVENNHHQGNLMRYSGFDPLELDQTSSAMYHVIRGEKSVQEVVVHISDQIDLLPSSMSLAETGARLAPKTAVNGVIKKDKTLTHD